jgi:hypothetical protein
LALKRKHCLHARTTFHTWFRLSRIQNLCRSMYKVFWMLVWWWISWISRIMQSVIECLLGSRIGCFCENANNDFRRRPPTLIKPSSSRNGLRLTILLLHIKSPPCFSLWISSANCVNCNNFSIRVSAIVNSFAFNVTAIEDNMRRLELI